MSADATTRYENVKKYKCHVTIEQWNNRSNLIIKLSKSYSKKNNRKKKSEKISKCHVCRRDHRATGSVTHITSDSKVVYARTINVYPPQNIQFTIYNYLGGVGNFGENYFPF